MNLQKLMYRTAIVCLVAAAAALTACGAKKGKTNGYEFVTITKANVERVVSATGSLKPVSEVNVLPMMSGKIEKLNVDYNYQVKKGDILAEINTDMLKLQRQQQSASVAKAKANYELQKLNFANEQILADKNLISEYELKTSKTTLDSATADLAAAQASLNVIDTQINQYAIIPSPIDGIIIDRRINLGDTVVDSANVTSSTMFTIAENLKAMQINAAVSELDIPSIRQGQDVRFTLESMPGRKFIGKVGMVQMVPIVTNNVVSYTVVVDVNNEDGSLLPGMSVSADFIVEHAEDVHVIPNAALRYKPLSLSAKEISDMQFNASLANMTDEEKQKAIEARKAAEADEAAKQNSQTANQNSGLSGLMMGSSRPRNLPPLNPATQHALPQPAIRYGYLWYLNNGKLEVMQLQTGITDGKSTELRTKENIEGKQIILRDKINAGN